jgi:C_GCAxxG_C_C family probable redox protein
MPLTPEEKEALLQRIYELGFEYEQKHRGCAQCAVLAIHRGLGLEDSAVYKAASGLAGGAGECTDGLCGAYSGAILVQSAIFGRPEEEAATEKGRAEKYDSFRLAAALHEKFLQRYGSVVCAGVQKAVYGRSFDLRSDAEKKAFRDAGAHTDKDKCCSVVGNGARWGAELILKELEARRLSLEDLPRLLQSEGLEPASVPPPSGHEERKKP